MLPNLAPGDYDIFLANLVEVGMIEAGSHTGDLISAVRRYAIIDSMKAKATTRKTQLIVRNLEEDVVRELKLRAARHGRSAEAEHREILREVLTSGKDRRRSVKEVLLAMPGVGEDSDFERLPDHGRDVEL